MDIPRILADGWRELIDVLVIGNAKHQRVRVFKDSDKFS
jgi:hypothetical protein